jgi:CO/xanthine dehydrogenase FAD-binding subunit
MEFVQPLTVEEIGEALNNYVKAGMDETARPVTIVAGAIGLLRDDPELKRVKVLMDISHVESLRYIIEVGGRICVGALSTYTDLLNSYLVRRYAPVLHEACFAAGTEPIRNRATIGGRLARANLKDAVLQALVELDPSVKLMSKTGCRQVQLKADLPARGSIARQPNEFIVEVSWPRHVGVKIHQPSESDGGSVPLDGK